MTAPLAVAVMGENLRAALLGDDMPGLLSSVAELDSMIRVLGAEARTPADRAALVQARGVVDDVLAALEGEMRRIAAERGRDARLRLAYAAPASP